MPVNFSALRHFRKTIGQLLVRGFPLRHPTAAVEFVEKLALPPAAVLFLVKDHEDRPAQRWLPRFRNSPDRSRRIACQFFAHRRECLGDHVAVLLNAGGARQLIQSKPRLGCEPNPFEICLGGGYQPLCAAKLVLEGFPVQGTEGAEHGCVRELWLHPAESSKWVRTSEHSQGVVRLVR